MAEFTEVMRQARRMCASYEHKCEQGCPLDHSNGKTERNLCILIGSGDGAIYEEIEHYVMRWAEDHPEPVYPSWKEAWDELFPQATNIPCPEICFGVKCCDVDDNCDACKDTPIPADIAAKLGIKPIDPDRFSCNECRYRGKPVLEEPCARCRRAEAPGSVGWAEMPDLWEVVPDDN